MRNLWNSLLVAFLGALLAGQARGQIFITDNNGEVGEYDATTGATINAALVKYASYGAAGVAMSGGKMWVINYFADTIGEYDATTGATINAALVSGLVNPYFLAVADGKLFVTNSYDNDRGGIGTIGEYDANTGATINAALVSGLRGPFGIAVSGGHLFVAINGGAAGGGTISEYDATTGATINAALVTGLTNPYGVAVSGGNLFVVMNNDRIGEYNAATGATVNASLVTGLTQPFGIAVSGENLFVVSNGGNDGPGRVGQYSAATGGTINPSLISGLNGPFGIAVSENTLPQSISDLISIINRQSTLSGGQQKSFVAKLQAAQSSIASSKVNAACGQLGALINDVNAAQRTGGLDQTTANILITFVQSLKQSLGCSP